MKVVVLGATGRLGRVLVPGLVAAGHDVVAVVRREEQLASVAALGASGVLGDVEGGPHGDLEPTLRGADVVVWTVGASRLDAAGHAERIRDDGIAAVAVAEQAGVGRWIQVSSLFANRIDQGPEVMATSLTNKVAVDEALQRSGLAWTIVRPGGLTDDPPVGTVLAAPETPVGSITRTDVADVIVELVRSGRGVGVGFDLVGGDTPIADAVAGLGA